jgi:hypothetical protein
MDASEEHRVSGYLEGLPISELAEATQLPAYATYGRSGKSEFATPFSATPFPPTP